MYGLLMLFGTGHFPPDDLSYQNRAQNEQHVALRAIEKYGFNFNCFGSANDCLN